MIDSHAMLVCAFAYLMIFSLSYFLLRKYDLNTAPIYILCLLSVCGHVAGAIYLYKCTINIGSDSLIYFDNASHQFGLGSSFAFFILGYQKTYLIGNSLLAAFLLAGITAFLGSLFYLLTFKALMTKISAQPSLKLNNNEINIFYPALLLLCWPTYLFWSAGIGKDCYTFLCIGLFLFTLVSKKTYVTLFFLLIASLGLFLVRPYLLAIILATTFAYWFTDPKTSLSIKLKMLIIALALAIIYWFSIQDYLQIMLNIFPGRHVTDIGTFIILLQEKMQATNGSVSMPTYNPHLVFLFLPYFMLINLFFPIGIGADSLTGWICSIENGFFLAWIIYIIRNRIVLKQLLEKIAILKFFLIYFFIGIICLSILNLNLGLAMREKMMYVPPLLIVIFLTYSYQRQLRSFMR